MAYDKVIDSAQLDADLTAVADAIREKTADPAKMSLGETATNIRKLPAPIVNSASGSAIALTDATDLKLRGLRIFGKTTQDGTPTPDAPVELVSTGAGESIGLAVYGKNILDLSIGREKGTGEGITYQRNSDGSYTRTGTASGIAGNVWFRGGFKVVPDETNVILTLLPGKSYFLRDCAMYGFGGDQFVSFGVDGVKTVDANLYPNGIKITGIRNPNQAVNTTYNDVIYPAVFLGDKDLGWEPYTAQTLPISTPNGLPGIPVTSGGNYTDEAGQQWVCDEVDFQKGVYVQRVRTGVVNVTQHITNFLGTAYVNVCYGQMIKPSDASFAGVANSTPPLLCECAVVGSGGGGFDSANQVGYCLGMATPIHLWFGFPYSTSFDTIQSKINGTKMVYELATPIETPLSAEELAAYAALHTKYPNTTVLNDAGAGMEVQYTADTKLYIDNKFNQLAAAMLTT